MPTNFAGQVLTIDRAVHKKETYFFHLLKIALVRLNLEGTMTTIIFLIIDKRFLISYQ